MKTIVSRPALRVSGRVKVPGDKSISHRAVMLGAIAEGDSEIVGFLPGEDCLATMAAVEAMGVGVHRHSRTHVTVQGRGLRGLRAAAGPLDMGNSGTAMRLFTGLLSAQDFDSVLVGDESLARRPMERVAVPLRTMGARIATAEGRPPVHISGGQHLQGIRYDMPVASAQVKSAVLLAGLYAAGTTTVREPAVTRDHTERMLTAFGCPVSVAAGEAEVMGGSRLYATRVEVPGDLSSATFLMLAGCLASEGGIVIDGVGLNPTRTGILEILQLMGADITVQPANGAPGGEPVGTVTARPSKLRGIVVPPRLVPLAIDEFPAIFVAAGLAEGETLVSGAAELRHKESDRIRVMADGLRAVGIAVTETPDGACIAGGPWRAARVESHGDHRVAMAFAVGALRAAGPVEIADTANVATSFPGFVELLRSVGLSCEEHQDARG